MKKLLCLLFMFAFLAACDDSGTSASESSKEKPITLDISVNSWNMLPNCIESQEGEHALVIRNFDKAGDYRYDIYRIYKCNDGEWSLVSLSVVPSLKDLRNSCNVFTPVMVLSEGAFYACDTLENKWTKVVDMPKNLRASSFSDSRDGQTYKTIKIGDQVWMAENLNYKADSSFCSGDADSNCTKWGRLYSRNAAINACPVGWHLPDTTEFAKLLETVGGYQHAGWMLAGVDSALYSDAFGFSAIASDIMYAGWVGYYEDGKRIENYIDRIFQRERKIFWSSTKDSSDHAYYMRLNTFSEFLIINSYASIENEEDFSIPPDQYSVSNLMLSVRCVKD